MNHFRPLAVVTAVWHLSSAINGLRGAGGGGGSEGHVGGGGGGGTLMKRICKEFP